MMPDVDSRDEARRRKNAATRSASAATTASAGTMYSGIVIAREM
jgi:hypothetical protein